MKVSESSIFGKLAKNNPSDIYVCLSSFWSSPVMKSSILMCRDNLNLTLTTPTNAIGFQSFER